MPVARALAMFLNAILLIATATATDATASATHGLKIHTASSTLKAAPSCLGEFVACGGSNDCVLAEEHCGRCKAGEYLCPSDQHTCVASAEAYTTCPGLAGTHLDVSLPIESRLDYLIMHTNVTIQAAQLTNTAPAIPHLGVPAYQWLNDDQHGVARTVARATVFPNGCALGATWSTATLREVGAAIGNEARGLHNGFLHNGTTNGPPGTDPRQPQCNGCGITLYAPNINLVSTANTRLGVRSGSVVLYTVSFLSVLGGSACRSIHLYRFICTSRGVVLSVLVGGSACLQSAAVLW